MAGTCHSEHGDIRLNEELIGRRKTDCYQNAIRNMRERCPKVAKEGYVNVLSDLIKDAKHSAGKLDIEFSKREERKMKRWQAQAEKQFISYIKKELINSGFVGKILR